MAKIVIEAGDVRLEAELDDTSTAREVLDALPVEAGFNVWGDEFYFEIPVDRDLDETATTRVRVGDIGYWPAGRALAVFFGPTPMSTGDDPAPAGEVSVVGRITGDAARLRAARDAGVIRLYKA